MRACGILAKTNVACAVGSSVMMSSTDFSFQNLVFFKKII
jgi:hypothetical protein